MWKICTKGNERNNISNMWPNFAFLIDKMNIVHTFLRTIVPYAVTETYQTFEHISRFWRDFKILQWQKYVYTICHREKRPEICVFLPKKLSTHAMNNLFLCFGKRAGVWSLEHMVQFGGNLAQLFFRHIPLTPVPSFPQIPLRGKTTLRVNFSALLEQ